MSGLKNKIQAIFLKVEYSSKIHQYQASFDFKSAFFLIQFMELSNRYLIEFIYQTKKEKENKKSLVILMTRILRR